MHYVKQTVGIINSEQAESPFEIGSGMTGSPLEWEQLLRLHLLRDPLHLDVKMLYLYRSSISN